MWFSCSITWSPSLTKYFIISSFSSIFKAVLCHLYLDSWGQNACSCLSVCSWYFYWAILILRRPATHTLARRGQWVMGLLANRRLLLWAERKGVCHLHHLVYRCTKLVHLVQNGSFFFGFVFIRWFYSPIYLLGTVMGGCKFFASPFERWNPFPFPWNLGWACDFSEPSSVVDFMFCDIQCWAIPGLRHCAFEPTQC